MGTAKAIPKRIDAPPLTVDGKPTVLYVGADFCPFCAAERWPVVVALSRFGTWSSLSASWPGRYYLQRWPSARAMAAVRGKVRDATNVRQVGRSQTRVVADLNPALRGWGGYCVFRGHARWDRRVVGSMT